MRLTHRNFLKSLLVILISSNSFSQELPGELRALICDLNERVLETTSEQKNHRYPTGTKSSKKTKSDSFTGKSYWICLDNGQTFLAFKRDNRPNLILDEFIGTKKGIYAVRIEGHSTPNRRYKWIPKDTKLVLVSIEKDVKLRTRNSSGEPIVKKGGSLRARGHIHFKDNNHIEIVTTAPIRPVLVKYEETTVMKLDID
tara:strand:+ start:225 stop:821 length:597 start_codon:yes stop_codon:yes gene_type:complete